MVVWSGIQSAFDVSGNLLLSVIVTVGSVCSILIGLVSVCLLVRRRSKSIHDFRQLLLPKKPVRPVIGFRTAAGPGGLKKSPSPEAISDSEWIKRRIDVELGLTLNEELSDSLTNSGILDENEWEESKIVSEIGDKKSRLNFSLLYSFEKNALQCHLPVSSQVNISNATNLHQLMFNGPAKTMIDPYLKLQLLPENQHKVKTKLVRNSVNPVYDEEFIFFGISPSQLISTTLHFAMIAFDRYSRDEILGEIICPLHNVFDPYRIDCKTEFNMELACRTTKFDKSQHRGELLISLCYQPTTNQVTIVVLKATNLPKFDVTGLADPYVKIYMLYKGKKLAKKKTHVKKRTLSPVYNESFVFDLPSSDPANLDHVSFELLLMDSDRVTRDELIGRCLLGVDANESPTGHDHWHQMRQNARRQIAQWYFLHP